MDVTSTQCQEYLPDYLLLTLCQETRKCSTNINPFNPYSNHVISKMKYWGSGRLNSLPEVTQAMTEQRFKCRQCGSTVRDENPNYPPLSLYIRAHCIWHSVTFWTVAHQVPLSTEFFQSRILKQVAIAFSRGSSQPRDRTHIFCISCIGGWALYH